MLFLSGNRTTGSTGASKPSSSSGSGSRGGKQDPTELAKEWKRNLQKEMRKIDREIVSIKREEERAVKECKKLAKANHLSSVKVLAKEIALTRKSVERMHTTKAMLNSVSMNLQASAGEHSIRKFIVVDFSCRFSLSPCTLSFCFVLIFRPILVVHTAMVKVNGCIAKSADIMHTMNQ